MDPNVQLGKAFCEGKKLVFPEEALKVIGSMVQAFNDNDKDGSGTLDAREMLEKLKSDDHYGFATDEDAEAYLKSLDRDGDGKIDREEWLRKTVISWANRTYIRKFLQFATKGKISRENLCEVMSKHGFDNKSLDEFIGKNKMDMDGNVDFKKFIGLFFDVDREEPALDIGKKYCAEKNLLGFSDQGLELIGKTLKMFMYHDKDGSGVLDATEVLHQLKGDDYYGFANETDVEAFVKDLDRDGSGKIERDEWVRKTVISWANRTFIKQFLEFANKGKVSRENIHEVMSKHGYDNKCLDEFITKNNLEKDGQIEFKQFVQRYFDVAREVPALDVGKTYCAKKKLAGFSDKAAEIIGAALKTFMTLDNDGSGTLDRAEILGHLKATDHYGFATDEDAEEFVKTLDNDGDGRIDREEWLRKTVISWANRTFMPVLMKKADKGKISREDLLAVMSQHGYDQNRVDQFIFDNSLETDSMIECKNFVQIFFDVDREYPAPIIGKKFCEEKKLRGFSRKAHEMIGTTLKEFNYHDKDSSGTLETKEIFFMLKHVACLGCVTDKDAEVYVKNLDRNGDGKLDREEWVRKTVLDWAKRTYSFQFDELSTEGKIKRADLLEVMGWDGYEAERLNEFIDKKSLDSDGIEFRKFLESFFDVDLEH